ncbi:VP1 [Eqcopivirus EqCoPV_9]|nr:VP1 [Eqcopivirus EqCoPV_9]
MACSDKKPPKPERLRAERIYHSHNWWWSPSLGGTGGYEWHGPGHKKALVGRGMDRRQPPPPLENVWWDPDAYLTHGVWKWWEDGETKEAYDDEDFLKQIQKRLDERYEKERLHWEGCYGAGAGHSHLDKGPEPPPVLENVEVIGDPTTPGLRPPEMPTPVPVPEPPPPPPTSPKKEIETVLVMGPGECYRFHGGGKCDSDDCQMLPDPGKPGQAVRVECPEHGYAVAPITPPPKRPHDEAGTPPGAPERPKRPWRPIEDIGLPEVDEDALKQFAEDGGWHAPKRQVPPTKQTPPPPNRNEQLANPEEFLKWLGTQTPAPGCRGTLTWPTHQYTGPGTTIPCGQPKSGLDQCSALHDLGYEVIQKKGGNPYLCGGCGADLEMIKCINVRDKSLGGTAVKALWQVKCGICKMMGYVDAPQGALTDANEGSQSQTEDHPRKKQKLESEMSSSSSTDTCKAELGGLAAQQPAPTPTLQGGGGGGTEKKGFWRGGTIWTETTVTTTQTRMCQITPWPSDYTAQSSTSDTPGLTVFTPWRYVDLDAFSVHWPPSDWQNLLETADAFRPVSLSVTIHELVAKDVSVGQTGCTTITDSGSAQMLILTDDGTNYPYVIGAGQDTIPGHLPGSNYHLPRYAYHTVGKAPKGKMLNPDTYSTCKWAPYKWEATQDSELFILENDHATVLHAGQNYTVNYHFPKDIPMEPLTQYIWDATRNANPWAKQRIKTVRPFRMTSKEESGQTIEKVTTDESAQGMPNPVLTARRNPVTWLPGPRHRDGDYLIIPEGAFGQVRGVGTEEPVVLNRDTIFAGVSKSKARCQRTLQPGPRSNEGAIQLPDGTLVVTTNAFLYKTPKEGINVNPKQWQGGYEGERLQLRFARGYDDPSAPMHIRERIVPRRGNFDSAKLQLTEQEDWEHYDWTGKQKEITYGDTIGQAIEYRTGSLESQIWVRIPNTDTTLGRPPLGIWALRQPPPMILLRMVPTPGPPDQNEGNNTITILPPTSFLNQYMNFWISYEMTWEYIPRNKNLRRWNPVPPSNIPMGGDARPIYTLNENGQYNLPPFTWPMRDRPRRMR